MIKLGMLIGGRYEVLEKIGTGGMSDVYKAKDQKLNRFVAVKVLKQEFSENRNFVSKFRVEAQAAAGLMHPNIVNVYDVGEENGIHYIVMELVEGITLKKYIEKKVRLTTKEAISIAIQVAMGIEAAHNNHIIHRDIKPQNIMISKEGKVKVTDFGIAKAASSNTITSNVMGSVHYTSPEQARGGFSDEKSDIYSMGITMFEMLTGRVPFNGDTTVAIAIKHIQDPMPFLRDFVPEIPVSVENIVMKCTQKSADRRYQSMGEMIADLKHSLINPDAAIAQVDMEDEAGKTKIVASSPEPIPIPAVLDTVWEDRVPRREAYADEEVLETMPDQGLQTSSSRRSSNRYEMDSYHTAYYEDDDYYGEVVMEQPAKTNRQKTPKATANSTGAKKTEKKPENKKAENKKPEAKKKTTANKKKQPQQNTAAKTSQ
ncbi:MAG: Stk1 family PASTA domain-containing Ser/Thr kinase, partial [Lachnospiraceae bacterium]|nr:Stk1 family PASTA domain-containing Ser/Thr kinase [Lachnospiraceae bacterium]